MGGGAIARHLAISPRSITFWKSSNQLIQIPAIQEDLRARQLFIRKFFTQFEISNVDSRSADSQHEYYILFVSFGIGAEFTFDRALLENAGVLNDLNSWIDDVNRRFKEASHDERYEAPWKAK